MSSEVRAKQAQFGMIGLAVMGRNLALNVEEHGFPVAVWNLETEWVDSFVNENQGKQLVGTKTVEDFVRSLERPRRMMMMIRAGAPVDFVLQRHPAPRRSASKGRAVFRRLRRLGRRGGRTTRTFAHARRRARSL